MVLFLGLLLSASFVLAHTNEFNYISGYGKTGREIIDIFRRTDPVLGDLCSDAYNKSRKKCDYCVNTFSILAEAKGISGTPHLSKFERVIAIALFKSFVSEEELFDYALTTHGDRIDARRVAYKQYNAIPEMLLTELEAYRAAHPELWQDNTSDIDNEIRGEVIFHDTQFDNATSGNAESASEVCNDGDCDQAK